MLDIVINSSSRPQYLIPAIKSYIANLYFSEGLNFILHEDVRKNKKDASEFLIKWAKENNIFDKIIISDPALGQGFSILELLVQVSSNKYVMRLEDDWILYNKIFLDKYIQVMDENEDVNQICFNNKDFPSSSLGIGKNVIKSGMSLIPGTEWSLAGSIWRINYILPRLISRKPIFTEDKVVNNANVHEWLSNNTGSYFAGDVTKQEDWFEHIGTESAMNEPGIIR